MCGIVGYVGSQCAAPILLEGLERLEYRGYDSAGIGLVSDAGIEIFRQVGRVRGLAEIVPPTAEARAGIGHTRWATHGPASEDNAHPQCSTDRSVAVVHNGIIDNAVELRAQLELDGAMFMSDTDTEVVAHLIANSAASRLEDAVLDALGRIVGTYAIAVIDEHRPNTLVVARNGSPLIIGVGEREMFVASDVAALVRHTSSVVMLDDGELATVTADGFRTFTRTVASIAKDPTRIDFIASDVDVDGHAHFMHKEIFEQPTTVERMLNGRLDERFGTARLDGLNLTPRELRAFRRVKVLGCGSAYYVGQLGAALIEELARVPADAEPASEFRYRDPVVEPDTLYVAVSQSGETADTLFAVQEVKRKGGRVVGLVNVVGSTVARECDGGIYLHAGPEVAVASTKALTHTAVAFALLALALARVRDLSVLDGQRMVRGLHELPAQIETILADEPRIAAAAVTLAQARSLFFIGRVRAFPVAREGAQKFKEVTYRHAEAYQTSELKHGPLALIDSSMPSVVILPDDELLDRNRGAMAQIMARGGRVLAVTHPGVQVDASVDALVVPKSEPELDAVLLTIPLQLLAYHAALVLGHDVDKPRNLAKSVTVE